MSAVVGEVYQWWCAACSEGDGTFDQYTHAQAAARRHDELNHEETDHDR